MQVSEFNKLLVNPEFIPGIYNYCDRWCEQCNFLPRCSVGTLEQILSFNGDDEKDIADDYSGMTEIHNTKMQDDDNDELSVLFDVDYSEGENEINFQSDIANADKHVFSNSSSAEVYHYIETHELNILALHYTLACIKWKNRQAENFPLTVNNNLLHPNAVNDAFEVIERFLMMIAVKIKRSLHSHCTDKNDHPINDFQTDYNGSAKIATTCMSRCIAAYHLLQIQLPADYNEIQNLIELLQSLLLKTNETFPHSEKFIRIGFDNPI